MGFLRRVHSVILRDELRTCEIREDFNVDQLFRRERSQLLTLIRPRDQNAPEKVGEASPAGCTHWKAAPGSTKD